jgi:hypothetical protein
MASRFEQHQPWVRDYLTPNYPQLVVPFVEAVRAFDRVVESGVLASVELDTMLRCAEIRSALVGASAAGLLGELAARFPAARNAVSKMSRDSKVHVRVNALVALHSAEPFDLHEEVLRTALTDRSAQVRRLAADKAMQFGLRQLLPDLEAAIEAERNLSVRKNLVWEHALLRDGYFLELRADKRVSVTFRTLGGGAAMTLVTAQELKDKGLKAIAKLLGALPPVG